MKRFLSVSIFIITYLFNSHAQTPQRAQVALSFEAKTTIFVPKDGFQESLISTIPLTNVQPFLAYAFVQPKLAATALWIRFSTDGENWEDWIAITQDTHGTAADENWVSQLQYAKADMRFYQYRWRTSASIEPTDVSLHFYNPGNTEKKTTSTANPIESRSCPCPQPSFEAREDWCPSGTCPKDATPAPNTVTHLIVHHSAGTNLANDWAAVVRAIWDFHTFTRGWDDIGYNWLVDPNGVIYEGRGENLIGAHFCGANTNTEGICVLGDFTIVPPTIEAVSGLVRWLAWKSCDADLYPIDREFHAPSGRNLFQVSGHRDGCATSCPGDAFYPLLDEVRVATIEYIDNNCNISSLLPAPYALTDSLDVEENSVILNWLFDLPSNSLELSLERSVDENYRYEEIARLASTATSYVDEDIELDRLYFYRLRTVSSSESSAYSNIVTVNTFMVNQENYTLQQQLKLFPNPSLDRTTLTLENTVLGKIIIHLQDLNGKTLQTFELNKTNELLQFDISTAQLPSGLYVLQVQQGKFLGHIKLVKQ